MGTSRSVLRGRSRRWWALVLAPLVGLVLPLAAGLAPARAATFTVSLSLSPSCMHVGNTNHSTATATVTSGGQPVASALVQFSSSGDVTFSDNGVKATDAQGHASVTITGSSTAGDQTITASFGDGSGTAVLTQFTDVGKVTLGLNPSSIAATGGTSTATVHVFTDAPGTTPGVACLSNVLLDNGGGDVTFDPIATAAGNTSGTYTSTIHSSGKPDTGETISATVGGHSDSKQLIEYGPAASVTVVLSPTTIVADGRDTSTATATVTDANGKNVLNETVMFSTDGDVSFKTGTTTYPPANQPAPSTNNHDGTYTTTIIASNTPNSAASPENIKATTSNGKFKTAPLVESPAPISLSLNPTSIQAGSNTSSTATATVTGKDGNGVAGEVIGFTRSGDNNFTATATTNSSGQASASIPASSTPKTETITANDAKSAQSASQTLTEYGAPSSIVLALAQSSIPATGGQTTATATVKDNSNPPKPVPGVNVGFSGDDVHFSSTNVVTDSNGVATTTITSSGTPDKGEIIRATTGGNGNLSDSKTLVEYGPAHAVTLTVCPPNATVTADGTSTCPATATVVDSNGEKVLNESVTFSTCASPCDVTFSPATVSSPNGSGDYETTLKASKTADQETITAKATKANVSGSAPLTETVGAATKVVVSLNPSTIPADGKSTSKATATVTDANNNAVKTETVTFAVSSGHATIGSTTNNGDGTYTATATASMISGNDTITATTSNNVSGSATLTESAAAPAWSTFQNDGQPPSGPLTSSPDVAARSPGHLDLFARGTDNALWHRAYDGTSWGAWESLGGALTSAPTVAAWSANRLDVFVRGTDNQLWHKSWDGTTWSGWEGLGGVLASGPDAAAWAAGRLDVFVEGTDSQLWHKWFDGTWHGWEGLGGVLTADPGVAAWGTNRLDVFVRGSDNQMWHKWWDGTAWRGYEPLGGTLAGGPDAASWGPGRLDVFARGTDNQLIHKWFDGAWRGFEGLGGTLASDTGATSWGFNRIDVFARANDGTIQQKFFG